MATVTVPGPANTAQIANALPNGCVIAHDTATDTYTIDADTYTAAQIQTAYQGIVYDPSWQFPADANATTIRQRALSALNANATYLAISTPTTAQMRDQLALVTKECNGIIRLLLGQLDSTSGTT